MVMRGQFLERPTLVPLGRDVMEGLSHRGERRPPLLVIPPRPDEGGSMDHVVAAEVVWAAATAGHRTLRFNYRGVGASQGERGTGKALVEEAGAALQVLEENAGEPGVAALAIGGSAQVLLELSRQYPEVRGVALIGPVGIAPEALRKLQKPLLVVQAEGDDRLPRAALSAAVSEAGGQLEVVERADRMFSKNLPEVGRAVVRWLMHLQA